MILFICNGCGSLMMMELRFVPFILPRDTEMDTKLGLYPATRFDWKLLYSGSDKFITEPTFLLIFGPYIILDLPIAIATDTILFPYDFYDSRQYWKVDEKMKMECSSVIEFVKNNKEVIEKAGGVSDVSLSTYKRRSNKDLPDRYVMSVYGLDKNSGEKDLKAVYVVIDVARQKGVVKFKLCCFTSNPYDYDCNESK